MTESTVVHSLEEALRAAPEYPCTIQPSFTLNNVGGGIAHNDEQFIEICTRGLELSPLCEIKIEHRR